MTVRQAAYAFILASGFGALASLYGTAGAQLIDRTLAPNDVNEGIAMSLADEIGAGRGDVVTPGSAAYIIARDPFRAIRRGRQLFQRKFTRAQGQGPLAGDGAGDVNSLPAIGAGLVDSCAGCHAPTNGFGDTQSISIGIQSNENVGPDRAGPRNLRRAPLIINSAFYPALMWDGRFFAPSGDPFDNSLGFLFPDPEGDTAFPGGEDDPVTHLLVAQAFIPPTCHLLKSSRLPV